LRNADFKKQAFVFSIRNPKSAFRNRWGFAELAAINYNSTRKENEGAPEISASINSISTINDCTFIRHSTR
jgi:hypothetical protein